MSVRSLGNYGPVKLHIQLRGVSSRYLPNVLKLTNFFKCRLQTRKVPRWHPNGPLDCVACQVSTIALGSYGKSMVGIFFFSVVSSGRQPINREWADRMGTQLPIQYAMWRDIQLKFAAWPERIMASQNIRDLS